METSQRVVWVVRGRRGHLVVMDYRAPVFWRRRMAVQWAQEHGLLTSGADADVAIHKSVIRNAPAGAK